MSVIDILVHKQDMCGESPIWDEQNRSFLWVDIITKKIHIHSLTSGLTTSWATDGLPTAIALRSSKPGLVVTFANGVDFFNLETGNTTHLCKPDPKSSNRNNEGKCDARGRFWVGSMQTNLNADGSDRKMDSNCGALFRVDPDGTGTQHTDHEIGLSNTMAWSADNKTFYFGDSARNAIYAFDYDLDDGALSNKRVHFEGYDRGAPDGSCIDSDGCLWNARFGGDDLRTLFITSARAGLSQEQLVRNDQEGAVLTAHVSVDGTPTEKFRG